MSTIRRLWNRFDPGFLIVLAISLLVIWPLISRWSLPEGTDAELHIFRLHELSTLIRGGEFYPRWAPNFYHGFGYPIFNYYAPLIYYLGLPFDLLPQVDAVLATKTVTVLGLVLGGMGMYGFVRDSWGHYAGYTAAALYLYSPYVQYVDPLIRGALPESLSFAIFPLALWALDKLRRRPSAANWIAGVLLVAAVILSHNLMGLLFFGLLTAWVVWQIMVTVVIGQRKDITADDGPGRSIADHGGRLLLALLLGLGAAAFFWLPVFLEREAVNLGTLIGAGDNYDFRTHFLTFTELLSPSTLPDWRATQPPFRFNLGIAQWMGVVLGVAMLILGRVRERYQLIFFTAAFTLLVFLMLPLSQPVWETVPVLPFFQFPWRLLGPAAAMAAIIGGAGVGGLGQWVGTRRDRATGVWVSAVAVAVTMLFGLMLSQPAPWDPFGEVNTLRMSLIENNGRWLGTTSTADYVPATVDMLPERRGSVVENIGRGLPPDRVNREAMPDGTIVDVENIRPLHTRYQIKAPKQFRLRLYQFDFPGWIVTVDGETAETELAKPEGFMVVLVPEGNHVVDVRFGSTPARSIAWMISVSSLLIMLAGAWILFRRRGDGGAIPGTTAPDRAQLRLDWPVLLVVALISLTAILLQPLGLFHYDRPGSGIERPMSVIDANLGDQITLKGYEGGGPVFNPGDLVDLVVYWQARQEMGIDYQSFVHVIDSDGRLVAQSDHLNPGEFPTRRWPSDKYVPDRHQIQLPQSLAPGSYEVSTGIWVQTEGWRLPVYDSNEIQVGDTVPLFQFEVDQ